jgi:hypothetical protein
MGVQVEPEYASVASSPIFSSIASLYSAQPEYLLL